MTNEDLYQSFLLGNDDAFTMLMERFGNPLVLYIYTYIKDFGCAEDLMIEVFSYLIVKKPKIKQGCLKSYLYKSARNLALRNLEKKRRNFSLSLEDFADLSDEKALLDSVLGTSEKYEILHRCMKDLPLDYREAIFLVYFEEMSHKEAGFVMGKREKQVSDLVYRGRQSLKIKLKEEGITHA